MTEEQLNALELELEDELQLFLDSNNQEHMRIKNRLKRHLKNGAFYLISKIGQFDIAENLTAREYVINYARYSYYGVLDEFHQNYQGDLRGLQIENFE
ncbi:hypothetical protein GC105_11455 [Alkalibaculum sp. M08DMB]|uniref:Uncharacterized protein n=1 Tax=Alkalibaculum sporogenes TaxID=2655001 RepID=A0A6A7KAM3_9FIRM|nr:hypothetical protein [Alkalibaculum sporogenes]MPW26405.1 hypothetical protein [Alkalibaculum sporogenes]